VELWIALISMASGSLLILAGQRDMFHTLFHPSGSGSLSDGLAKVDWRVFRLIARRRPSIVDRAGPQHSSRLLPRGRTAGIRWALLYWQHLPNEFGLRPQFRSGPRALYRRVYLSLVTVATLGFGDITPTHTLAPGARTARSIDRFAI